MIRNVVGCGAQLVSFCSCCVWSALPFVSLRRSLSDMTIDAPIPRIQRVPFSFPIEPRCGPVEDYMELPYVKALNGFVGSASALPPDPQALSWVTAPCVPTHWPNPASCPPPSPSPAKRYQFQRPPLYKQPSAPLGPPAPRTWRCLHVPFPQATMRQVLQVPSPPPKWVGAQMCFFRHR